MILALKILGAIAALAFGIWLGLPGRYRQDLEDIERTMQEGSGRRRPIKRTFTPLGWLRRGPGPRVHRGQDQRRRFELQRPEDR